MGVTAVGWGAEDVRWQTRTILLDNRKPKDSNYRGGAIGASP